MLHKCEKEWLGQYLSSNIINVSQLNQAITNVVFLITCADKSQLIFKRLNKTALTQNERKNEVLVHERAFQHGLTGRVVAVSERYCLQEYIQGKSLNGAEITDKNLSCLSTQLSRVHKLSPLGILNQNLTRVVLSYCAENNNNQFEQECFDRYLALAKRLDKASPLDCLCHSDLSFSNLVKNEKQAIYILDWEYAVRGCRAYDIGICCSINELNAQQSDLLIAAYLSENKQQTKQEKALFIEECKEYALLFTYINTAWNLYHNA